MLAKCKLAYTLQNGLCFIVFGREIKISIWRSFGIIPTIFFPTEIVV